MNRTVSRRFLQAAILLGGLVPVLAGGSGMILGPAFLGEESGAAMDSHFRYLSALLFAIGLAFWSCAVEPESKEARARLLTAIVFVGGLARLGGALREGFPPLPMTLAIGMELIVTPSLYLWLRSFRKA
jgi:hypothetical protein